MLLPPPGRRAAFTVPSAVDDAVMPNELPTGEALVIVFDLCGCVDDGDREDELLSTADIVSEGWVGEDGSSEVDNDGSRGGGETERG